MINKISRRAFIRKSAEMAAIAALTTSSASILLAKDQSNPNALDGLVWNKAPCRFCGTGCGLIVGVKDGRVVAVQGDKENPVNRGLLCVKGYHVGSALYGKDRLTSPQIRKNGKLTNSSWEEAIDLIATNIMKAPEKFSIYGSGQWTIPEGYTAMKFMKGGLSSNQIDPNARLCMASAVVGFIKTFGVDEPSGCYDDLDVCDTVICWGNNWAEMHPILYSRFIDRKNKHEKITMIDLGTRRTRTSNAADHYLEFVPQTDMVIANGIAHLLLKNKTIDEQFVNDRVGFKDDAGNRISLDEYAKFLELYTPEYVEKISNVSAGHIKMLADIFGDPKRKVVSLWCMGMNQHTRGTAINNLVYNIHLLTGKIGKPGSTPFSLTGQPSACGTCREVGTLAHALPGGRVVKNAEHRKETEDIWNCIPGTINAKPGFHTIKMFKALAKGDLTSMWVQVTNPAHTIPHLHENLKNAKDRFVVVSDVYPTATTELASVVLPSAMWVEKNGVFGNSERRTQQWFKMVNPPGEARDDVWQMLAVARKLFEMGHKGMKDKDGNFLLNIKDEKGAVIDAWKWDTFKKYNVDKSLFNEYRNFTFKKKKNIAPYDEYVKNRGLRWPVVQNNKGNWVETKRRFVEGEDPFVEKGDGVSFYMAKAGDKKALVWARPYEKPPEIPDKDYPFWLCTGRVIEHWHSGTMTRRIKELNDAMPEAYVELHPQDADKMNVYNGDLVRVRSRRGSIVLKASIRERSIPQKGLVFVPFFDETKLINNVTLDAYCPFSKEPDYKKCAVKLEKV